MNYPFTPDYLESLPEYLVTLQRQLQDEVISDICRRICLSGELTESAIHQIMVLRNKGLDMPYIDKQIAQYTHLSEQEIKDLFDRALERNQQYYDYVIKKADIVPSGFSFARMEQQFNAIRRQTLDEFKNITQSMGFAVNVNGKKQFMPIAKTYQQILDNALIKVSSGAFDYNSAIKGAVDSLADSGLQWVDYASGWHNRIDVAARRAVMTGITQLAGKYSEQIAEDVGTDLVEVTAHGGARDTGTGYLNHKSWQGKVYSMSGNHPRYKNLKTVTGYGLGGGLMGWNCRHAMYPYLEGVSERTYTDEQLRNIDPKPFDYQGRQYNAYQATQQQRKIETAIRDVKRRMVGYEAAGLNDDFRNAAIKLGRLRTEYKSFSSAAGFVRQPERYRVAGFGQKQAAKARKKQSV